MAACTTPAAIFVAPDVDSFKWGYVEVGESVTVTGRASSGRWLYIRDHEGKEGFVWLPYFNWPGELETLPTRLPTVTPPTPPDTPTPKETYPPLGIDFWHLLEFTRCAWGNWHYKLYIRGQGGDQVYTYYLDGEHRAGPLTQDFDTPQDELVYTFEVEGVCGAARIVTGRVESGDGQIAERELFLDSPPCCSPP
jgi:hypothetical protein